MITITRDYLGKGKQYILDVDGYELEILMPQGGTFRISRMGEETIELYAYDDCINGEDPGGHPCWTEEIDEPREI